MSKTNIERQPVGGKEMMLRFLADKAKEKKEDLYCWKCADITTKIMLIIIRIIFCARKQSLNSQL